MNTLEMFARYATDFEETYLDDNWDRLRPYFHEDASYEVCNMPFFCTLAGRDAVFRGIKKSLDGFDRRCTRSLAAPAVFKAEGSRVLVYGSIRYECEGFSTTASLWEIVSFRDGLIAHIMDIYAPGHDEEYLRWIAQLSAPLDASYN